MPRSLAKILLHTIFSTKERRPFLQEAKLRDQLHYYLGGILKRLDCQPVIVGGVADHVHLLAVLSRSIQVAQMVKELKRSSSLWIKAQEPGLRTFAWQNGYGAFSIGFSQLEEVRHYTARQQDHRQKLNFQDEFRLFLKRCQIAFDERHVWD
jgi:putative transposase